MAELVPVTNRKIPEVFSSSNDFHDRYVQNQRLHEAYKEGFPGVIFRQAGLDYKPEFSRPSQLSGESVDLGECYSTIKRAIPGSAVDGETHIDAESFKVQHHREYKDIFVHYALNGRVKVELALLAAGFENPHRARVSGAVFKELADSLDRDHVDPAKVQPFHYSAEMEEGDALAFLPSRALHRFITLPPPELVNPSAMVESIETPASRVSIIGLYHATHL